jgi:hypothetical protein
MFVGSKFITVDSSEVLHHKSRISIVDAHTFFLLPSINISTDIPAAPSSVPENSDTQVQSNQPQQPLLQQQLFQQQQQLQQHLVTFITSSSNPASVPQPSTTQEQAPSAADDTMQVDVAQIPTAPAASGEISEHADAPMTM